MIDVSKVTEHMDVVGSDGQHVGTVDNIGIKLTKNDSIAHDQLLNITIKVGHSEFD